MKIFPNFFLALGAFFALNSAQAACTTEQCLGFKSDFEMILKNGKEIYCYWDLKRAETHFDYDAIAKKTVDLITDETSMTDFYWLMRNWAGFFHDGHVNFMLSKVGPKISVDAADIRFDLLSAGSDRETLIVTEAEPALGIQLGDEIVGVGSLSAEEAINQTIPTTSGSTPRMRRFFGARRLIEVLAPSIAVQNQMTFHMRRKVGEVEKLWSVQVPLRTILAPQTIPASESEKASPFVYSEILTGNIGYLRIDAFSQTQAALEKAMDELAKTDSLIIDVRKNGGGDQSGDAVLARFIAREMNRYSVSPRASKLLVKSYPSLGRKKKIRGTDFTRWYSNPVLPAKRADRFQGKQVLVLTSPNCFSACDTFVSALQTYKLAKIVGEGSGGGTGSPLVFYLPYTKHQFRYSVFRGRTSQKKWIEGVGTLPQFPIAPTTFDRAQGIDTQLNRAIELAGGQPYESLIVPFGDGQSLEKDPITLELEQAALQQAFWD